MKCLEKRLICLLLLVLFVVPQTHAQADDEKKKKEGDQADTTVELKEGDKPDTVVEMVVTTRKREEKLQDVPITVSAFSAETIAEAGMASIADISAFTPGFSFETAFGRQADRPVFRGMSNILGAPNAGVFIDGVFVSGSIQSTELANIERVEVIKGPQSALYGRSTFAGAINYITRKPTNNPTGRAQATLAEHGQQELTFNHAGPLVKDRWLYAVSARSYNYDGEYRNTVTDQTIGGEKTLGMSGSLSYINSHFDMVLRLAYTEDDDDHFPIALQDSAANNCFNDTAGYFCGVVHTFDSVSLNTDDLEDLGISGLERDTLRSSLTLNWDLDNVMVTSISSYNAENLASGIDQDFTGETPFRGAFQTAGRSDLIDLAQEIRFSSKTSGKFDWLAGLYYYDRTNEDDPLDDTPPSADLNAENIAGFAMLTYRPNDALSLTFEGRFQEDTISVSGGAREESFEESYSSFNPRATFSYKPSNIMFYGSIAMGNKPGGINRAAQLDEAFRNIEEEESVNYETGIKTNWNQGRTVWNLSGYFIDWTDQQLTTTFQDVDPDGTPLTISYIDNAGETEVYGLETELWHQVTDFWNLNLSYAHTNAEFTEYDVREQAALTGNASVAGNTTPRSPEHQAVLANTFRGSFSSTWNWSLRGDLLYEGSRYAQVHNLAETGETTKLNLRLNLESSHLKVSLWGRNLTVEDAAVSVLRYVDANAFGPPSFSFPRAFAVTLPRGRQVGITATYQF